MPFRVVGRNSSAGCRPRTFVLICLLATSTRTFVLLSLFYKKIRKILKVRRFKNRCSIRVVIESRCSAVYLFRVVRRYIRRLNLKDFRIFGKTLDKHPKIGYNGISSDERRRTQQNSSGERNERQTRNDRNRTFPTKETLHERSPRQVLQRD